MPKRRRRAQAGDQARTQQLWRTETTGPDGKLIAQGQVRLANLDQPVPPEALAHLVRAAQE